MEWVSVKDRLPDKTMDCIVYGTPMCGSCGDKSMVTQARFKEDGRFEFGEYDCGIEVTYWMPLPEAPKE